MKHYFSLLTLSLTSLILGQNSEDKKSIKNLCGCYEVTFNFSETFSYPKDTANYIPSEKKREHALEWIQIVEESDYKLVLQHLLIVGKNSIVKHWREDWIYENTDFFEYNGNEDWKYKQLPKNKVKNQWTQKVYEVDDKPRYEGSASWIHVDGRHFWENTTNAPLPRREYTKRDDYNITERTNRHELSKDGWFHDQDNKKIIRNSEGKDYLLAEEKGFNTYKKVEDLKCEAAQKWWTDNKDFWKKVRIKWEMEFKKNKDIKLEKYVDNKPLFMHLQALKTTASQDEINKTIDLFIIK
ncbi:MAG: DUF6607 family protein [Flavobacterium sp.]